MKMLIIFYSTSVLGCVCILLFFFFFHGFRSDAFLPPKTADFFHSGYSLETHWQSIVFVEK